MSDYKEIVKQKIKQIVDEKFEGDYEKYVSKCKKDVHVNSIIGLIEMGVGAFVVTGMGILPTFLLVMGVLTMLKGFLNFRMITNIEEAYKD